MRIEGCSRCYSSTRVVKIPIRQGAIVRLVWLKFLSVNAHTTAADAFMAGLPVVT